MTDDEKVVVANAVHRALRERFGWVAEGTWETILQAVMETE